MTDEILSSPDRSSALLRTGFHAVVNDGDAAVVVGLHGELDMSGAPQLVQTLNEIMDARPAAVIVDASELSFLDSTGIRVLIMGCRRAAQQDCSFTVRSLQARVLRTLKLTGVDDMLRIEPEEASR